MKTLSHGDAEKDISPTAPEVVANLIVSFCAAVGVFSAAIGCAFLWVYFK